MAYFAVGPLASGNITARQIVRAGLESDLPAVPSGSARVDVTTAIGARDPNSFVGRQFAQATGALVGITQVNAIAARRPEWFSRLGAVYRHGMDGIKTWWPTQQYENNDARLRAQDVVDYEIPNWWYANVAFASTAVRGEVNRFGGMTEAQIEAVVGHLENLLTTFYPADDDYVAATGIIHRWYLIGRVYNIMSPPSGSNQGEFRIPGTERDGTEYANPVTVSTGYTDAFSLSSGTLLPKQPDYSWQHLTGYYLPDDFNPENPS